LRNPWQEQPGGGQGSAPGPRQFSVPGAAARGRPSTGSGSLPNLLIACWHIRRLARWRSR